MARYETQADFAHHIEEEGLDYYFFDYENVTRPDFEWPVHMPEDVKDAMIQYSTNSDRALIVSWMEGVK